MNRDLERAKSLLISEGYTCVLVKDGDVRGSRDRGVKSLLDFLSADTAWKDYSAADKVVGRAAAFIYVKLGIDELYAKTLSKSALEVLTRYGVKFSFGELAETIKNRRGDGVCPMERATTGIDDPDRAIAAVKAALASLQNS